MAHDQRQQHAEDKLCGGEAGESTVAGKQERGKRHRDFKEHLQTKTAAEVMNTEITTVREDSPIDEVIVTDTIPLPAAADPSYVNIRGMQYFNTGDMAQARPLLEEACRRSPASVPFALDLAASSVATSRALGVSSKGRTSAICA